MANSTAKKLRTFRRRERPFLKYRKSCNQAISGLCIYAVNPRIHNKHERPRLKEPRAFDNAQRRFRVPKDLTDREFWS